MYDGLANKTRQIVGTLYKDCSLHWLSMFPLQTREYDLSVNGNIDQKTKGLLVGTGSKMPGIALKLLNINKQFMQNILWVVCIGKIIAGKADGKCSWWMTQWVVQL